MTLMFSIRWPRCKGNPDLALSPRGRGQRPKGAGEGSLLSFLLEGCLDRLKNTIEVFHDLVIPESEYTIPLRNKRSTALFVICAMIRVLAAINLNNKPRLKARKISDIGGERNLAAELGATQLAVADRAPKSPFGFRLVPAELTGSINRVRPLPWLSRASGHPMPRYPSPSHRFAMGPSLSHKGRGRCESATSLDEIPRRSELCERYWSAPDHSRRSLVQMQQRHSGCPG